MNRHKITRSKPGWIVYHCLFSEGEEGWAKGTSFPEWHEWTTDECCTYQMTDKGSPGFLSYQLGEYAEERSWQRKTQHSAS